MNSERYNPKGGGHSQPPHGRHAHPASDVGAKGNDVFRLDPLTINGVAIPQRADGYSDATVICDTCSKSLASYVHEERTGELLDAISSQHGIPRECIIQQGDDQKTGEPVVPGVCVWIHPVLAVELARWCSPGFGVELNTRFREFFKARIATHSMPDFPPEISDLVKVLTEDIAQSMRRGAEQN